MLARLITILTFFICVANSATAVEYDCIVERKFDSQNMYSTEHLERLQFSVKVIERAGEVFLSRCSLVENLNKITCDEYKVDKVEFDERVKVKKFYVFSSQFDVQIFQNLTFIENNGRGGIAFGKCKVASP